MWDPDVLWGISRSLEDPMRLAADPVVSYFTHQPNTGAVFAEFRHIRRIPIKRRKPAVMGNWGRLCDSHGDLEIPRRSNHMRLTADPGRRIFPTPAPIRGSLRRILADRENSV